MDDLTQWLGERLDEDARRLRAATDEAGGEVWQYDGRYIRALPEGDMMAVGSQDLMEAGVGEHVAEHDPARVLREIDAKRQIMQVHNARDSWGMCVACPRDERGAMQVEIENCPILRALALPYADRPGYLESWRP